MERLLKVQRILNKCKDVCRGKGGHHIHPFYFINFPTLFSPTCQLTGSCVKLQNFFLYLLPLLLQGPRSDFEIGMGGGGGAPLVPQYWGGGTRHFFLLTLFNFKNIGGGGTCPPATSTPRSPSWPISLHCSRVLTALSLPCKCVTYYTHFTRQIFIDTEVNTCSTLMNLI